MDMTPWVLVMLLAQIHKHEEWTARAVRMAYRYASANGLCCRFDAYMMRIGFEPRERKRDDTLQFLTEADRLGVPEYGVPAQSEAILPPAPLVAAE